MTPSTSTAQTRNYTGPFIIVGALFFIFGFVTWLNGILIPYLKIACELTNFESYLVAFAFYISYTIMAVPSSGILNKTGFKNGMAVGLLIMAVGALIFVPAALTRTYAVFLIGLFVVGTGLTLLQTASNPYVTILGPRESAAARISIMGICNKIAGSLAPIIFLSVVMGDADETDRIVEQLKTMDAVTKAATLDELASRVVVPYLVMAGILVALALATRFANLPEVDPEEEDPAIETVASSRTSVTQFPNLILGVIAIFLYVGVEVIAGDTVIAYALSKGLALSDAKNFTSYTLWAMVIMYAFGAIAIPKVITQGKALIASAVLGVILSLAALFLPGLSSVWCISLLGIANALMWPAIWPLALHGLGRYTKVGSSLLIMGISGGALLPLLYGSLVDSLNAQQAYWILVPAYVYLLYYALVGSKKVSW